MSLRERLPTPRILRVLLLLLAVPLLPACTTEKEPGKLSPRLNAKLEEVLHRARYSQGMAKLGDLRQLSAFGPAATQPVVDQLLSSDNPQLRSNAVFVLGEIYRLDRDEKAIEAVRGAVKDPDRLVRLEAARALLENGDRSGINELVDALDDPGRGTRTIAFLALREASGGVDFGYHPGLDTVARQEPIARFRAHYAYGGSGE
ncbi:MAG: HEAT repeat domain-containing protein [Planctomycetota bacterium]